MTGTNPIGPKVRGLNHLALVCSDMARTVDFYTNVLGFPLVKTVELPGGHGQHFFFDIGNGNGQTLAFFWFPNAPESIAGVTHQGFMDSPGGPVSAVATMNHVAFDVAPEDIEALRERLKEAGVKVSPIVNHDDSELGASREVHPGVFVRSIYFRDPDDIQLEFAAWTKVFDESDVRHAPTSAAGVPA
jgi:catechol 2,3-dioxygenase-like lactoylglutathione lyase family enzyme